ncbi:Amino Acid-Polyamine-Organocation (APC) Family [Achlya hypogyna]|uniref:Amino Acid-Polyamine-Organocation (APC) Family n=1 Tax=Achlya hypogyna TaxID=1202772 RepID=A0A1V9YQS6_ACHHY|nr:Amino Acid-Polyamine-Organocation (APC) Family [Achlya hypogyna]
MGMAYIVYMSSAAEVSGKIAFSGGSYGLARITLGYYCGFIVGFVELLEYVASAAVSVSFVGEFVVDMFSWPAWTTFIVWLVFYALVIGLFQLPGRIYWRFMVLFAIVCLLPTALVVLGSIGGADLGYYGAYGPNATQYNGTGSKVWATGDMESAFFAWLPYTTWAYAGVESLTLVTNMAVTPKTTIPRGMLAATWTLFASNILLVFLVPSLEPGIATSVNDDYPLSNAMTNLGISDYAAQWLILPAQMGMAAGFFLPYTRLTQALANSNLLPPILGLKNQASMLKPMTAASVFGYILCVIGYMSPAFESAMQNLFILAGTFCYVAQLVGFVMLRTTFHTETTGYTSPYGIPGAIFASTVYFFLALAIVGGFQGDDGVAVIALTVFVSCLSIYYHLVCKTTQSLSKDEYACVFKFSIMKYNTLRLKHGRKARTVTKLTVEKRGLGFLRRGSGTGSTVIDDLRGNNRNSSSGRNQSFRRSSDQVIH